MNCEDASLELDAYVSGELDSATVRQVEDHVAECSECAEELKTLREENSIYRSFLSTLKAPAGDWKRRAPHPGFFAERRAPEELIQRTEPASAPGIRHGQWLTWGLAASLIATLGVAIYFYNSRRASESDRQAINSQVSIEEYNLDDTVIGLNQAVAALGTAYAQKKQELDPTIIAELDRNLGVIDQAIAECQQALKEDPRNDQAAEFLVIAYEKKIDLLKQMTED